MIHFLLIVFIVSENVFIVNTKEKDRCDNVRTSLNVFRKRRHLTFPEGTMVVVSNLLYIYLCHEKNNENTCD